MPLQPVETTRTQDDTMARITARSSGHDFNELNSFHLFAQETAAVTSEEEDMEEEGGEEVVENEGGEEGEGVAVGERGTMSNPRVWACYERIPFGRIPCLLVTRRDLAPCPRCSFCGRL